MRIYLWYPACTLPAGANLGNSGPDRGGDTINAPPDQRCRIFIDDGVDPSGRGAEILEFEICDQYTIQGDLFSQSIRQGTELAVPLESSVRNMAVIEAIFRSAKSGKWEEPLRAY